MPHIAMDVEARYLPKPGHDGMKREKRSRDSVLCRLRLRKLNIDCEKRNILEIKRHRAKAPVLGWWRWGMDLEQKVRVYAHAPNHPSINKMINFV